MEEWLPMISVIIPAYNEGRVIGPSLDLLVSRETSAEIEIIVVCNGCTDLTVEIVKSYMPMIKCIVTEKASKSHALNLGDAAAKGFPRFYLDADVLMSKDDVLAVAYELQKSNALVGSPIAETNMESSSWLVRSYYKVWLQLPYVVEGMVGTGVYVLTQEGRGKFSDFPDLIADDGYIRALFKADERLNVDRSSVEVKAPHDFRSLVMVNARVRLGRYELAMKFPELIGNETKDYSAAIRSLLISPSNWLNALVYLFGNLVARFLANKQLKKNDFSVWLRDESSRI
ncbi:glycosyltransferase [Deltaproteobacteria bacterium IMCC39524]|nr:glycosyltransferase [Deltaproteobacteria bacterium IMCC39524]